MRLLRRGPRALLVPATLLLTLASAACSTSAPPARRTTPAVSSPSAGPGAEALIQRWAVRWVRAFLTLGQGVDQFRQAVREKDQQAIAQTARPIEGAAAQLTAALELAGPFPDPVASLEDGVMAALADVQHQAREVTRVCPGDGCLETAQPMYDETERLLDGFRSIFQKAGVPLPEPS
jgi:hypothetical protein